MERKEYLILIFLASALLFGYAYGLNMPQALEKPLREQPFNFDNLKFNLLYVFTFAPTVLFEIPLGVLIDKYPIRRSMYILVILSFVSQLVAGLAFQFMLPGYQWLVYLTRSIFGSCGQALFTVQIIILTNFGKQQYEMIVGICLCLPFIMDAINSITTTHVYDATNYMALTWYIGAFVASLSLIAAYIIDKKYITVMIAQEQNRKWQLQIKGQIKEEQHQQFNFKKLSHLSSQCWVVMGAIFFFQASIGPFLDNLNDLIVKRFNIAYTDAGKMLLIPLGVLVIFAYIISKICTTRPQWRRRIMLIVSILFFLSMCGLYLLPNTNEPTATHYITICLCLLMISAMFATEYCALITSITYLVDQDSIGTAYGVVGTSLGTCQCFVPLVNSAILDQYTAQDLSYQELSLFGAGLAIFPIIFSIWMLRKQFQILDYNLKDDFRGKSLEDIITNDSSLLSSSQKII